MEKQLEVFPGLVGGGIVSQGLETGVALQVWGQ